MNPTQLLSIKGLHRVCNKLKTKNLPKTNKRNDSLKCRAAEEANVMLGYAAKFRSLRYE